MLGRDQAVRGPLQVTLAPTLASHLLMPDFAEFARLHPEIEMDVLSSDQPVPTMGQDAQPSAAPPCKARPVSSAPRALRGVWHAPQWPSPSTR